MIKKFKNIIKDLSFYFLIISILVLLIFYILEKSVRVLELAQFQPMGQNWDQLKLSDSQIREIFEKNNDEINSENEKGIYTGYDPNLSYVTKGPDDQIYYRQYEKKLNNCSTVNKIYLFGSSLVAGDGVPKNKDLLSSQLSSIKEVNDNCNIIINRGISGHNFNQMFENVLHHHNEIDGDIVVIFGINSFINNVYSDKQHMLEDRFKQNFKYITADSFKETTKIYIYDFVKKLHSVKFFNQYIDNNYKIIDKKEYWYKSNIFLDSQTIKNRTISSCKVISSNAFLLKEFLKKKNKKIIFLKQPVITNLDNLNEFEKQIKNKTEQYLLFMKNIENGESYFFESYKEYLNICEKEFNKKNLQFLNLNFKKKNLNKTYFIDYIHMTPSGIKELSYLIFEKLIQFKFLNLN